MSKIKLLLVILIFQLLSVFAIIILMNRKHQKILTAIFTKPTLANSSFSDIEKLVISLGGEIEEGNGSRVAFKLNGEKAFAHRPHPEKEDKKYQVEAFREFFILAGIGNE